MSEKRDAERYESRHPSTGVGSAQAAERQQRADLRGRPLRRTNSIIVPALPWLEKESDHAT